MAIAKWHLEVNGMDDKRVTITTCGRYQTVGSSGEPEARPWKASLMEKTWIALMAIALFVAALNAVAEDGSNMDSQKTAKSLKSVLTQLVMR